MQGRESNLSKGYGKDICKLVLGINPLNFDVTICNMGAEVVILNCDVLGMRPHFGGFGKLNAIFVVFKNGRMGNRFFQSQALSRKQAR